jgi:1-acyl-sn-glycerol-3-phosphate acyltransferase
MMLVLRSALFLLWFAVVSVVMNVMALPVLLLPARAAMAVAALWGRAVLFGLKHIAGIRLEIRGRLEQPQVLIASKHFSMWETIAFLAIFPRPAIVMKQSLLRIPLYGWYCRKMGMIAIDRSAGASAIRGMATQAKRALNHDRPIVIFPEGTRKTPGAAPDYKPGVAALYAQLKVPCVPIAHNSGLFWDGFFKRPGTIIVQLLDTIPPGLRRQEFMAALETRIEEGTRRLLEEAHAASEFTAMAHMDYNHPSKGA